VTLKWQAGVFAFTQNYQQDAVNNFSPFVLSQFLNFPIQASTHRQSTLDDRGLGVYGQGTFTFASKLDLIAGARGDRAQGGESEYVLHAGDRATERRQRGKDFSDVSPQMAVAYRVVPRATIYGTVGRGYKAGGFNSASPAGAEAYGQEHSWNYEGGVKTSAFSDRLSASNRRVSHRLKDVQVNVPNVLVPGQFFIANAAGRHEQRPRVRAARAARHGARPLWRRRVHARAVLDGSVSNGVNVSGNKLAKRAKLYRRLRRSVLTTLARRAGDDGARRGDLLRRLSVR